MMEEKDIVRIALVVLLLGFSLPEILRLISPGIAKSNTRSKREVIQTDPPVPQNEDQHI